MQVLRDAQELNKAVSVYHAAEGDSGRFEVGFVESISSSTVTLGCANSRGEADGTLVLRIEDLDVVEIDDAYTRKIELLSQFQGSIFKPSDSQNADSFEGQLQRASDDHLILTAEDDRGHRFTGFVHEHGDDYFVLNLVNAYGAPDGQAVLQKGCIVKIEVDRRDEQVRGFLYRYHYELKKLIE